MARRNRNLILQFVLSMAVCAVVAVLDRPLIGLVGAAICIAIFAIRACRPTGSRLAQNERSAGMAITPGGDEETASSGLGTHSYNPRNPAFPLYYPPADRD